MGFIDKSHWAVGAPQRIDDVSDKHDKYFCSTSGVYQGSDAREHV